MALTRVHVNRSIIARNLADGLQRPVYTIKQHGSIRYAHSVIFTGHTELIDPRFRRPLSCGARAYLETHDDVILVDPCSYDEAISLVA